MNPNPPDDQHSANGKGQFEGKVQRDNSSATNNDDSVGEEQHDELPELSDCLRFIERVRQETPACLWDMLTPATDGDSGPDAGSSILGESSPRGDEAGLPFSAVHLWSNDERDFPAEIGRFQILRKLGEGGFGLVFLAFDPELHRHVALKVPRVETLIRDETRHRFLREAKAAASLNHRNIAAVHEAGQVGPICFIVSAYCNGGSLADFIQRVVAPARSTQSDESSATTRSGISFESVTLLMETVSRAVQHAHDRGILHRDLKPGNILFEVDTARRDSDSEEERADLASLGLEGVDLAEATRIVDFGLAKLLDSDDQHTRTGMTLGTPSYMSPEQAQGDKAQIGPTTDVYSLGAILYELLTGRPAFQKSSHVETIVAVKNDDPVPPRRINRECPKDLEAVCMKCLEKEPARRYATAVELADEFRRFLRGEPVKAQPATWADRSWRWCRRHPPAALLIVLVVALAIVGPVVAINQTRLYRAAEEARYDVSRTLYMSDMNLALRDWDEANLERCGELLRRHLPETAGRDYRGFEWFYLWRLWRRSEGVPVVAHADDLQTMAVSPDEKLLAIGCHDGTVFLVNRDTGREISRWQAHPYGTVSLEFSHDGKRLVSANVDNEVKLWDVTTHRELASLSGSRSVEFSPVDGTLAYRTANTSIAILEEGQTEPRIISDAHEAGIGSISFSPDGRSMASVGWDGTVRLWTVKTRARQRDLDGHEHTVWRSAWSPNGRYLATGDVYGHIKLWDVSTGAELRSMNGHRTTIEALTFSPDSATLASSGGDNTVKLWEIPSGSELSTLRGHYGKVTSLAFVANGTHLLTASIDGDVKSWEIAAQSANDILEHPDAATSVAFLHDSQLLATSCSDGQIRLWQATTGHLRHSFHAHDGGTWLIRLLTLDGRPALVSTGRDSVMRFWDLDSRQIIRELACRPNSSDPPPLTVTLDASKLAFANTDITVTTWDLVGDTKLSQQTVGMSDDFEFSPDGRTLAIAAGRSIKIQDVATGRELCDMQADSRYVICLAFSPDGQTMASGSFDRTVKLWKLARGQDGSTSLRLFRVLRGPAGPVIAVAYSPDGSVLASAGDDRVVRLWDPVTGQQRAALSGHTAGISDLAFSPDGKTLASAGNDFTVRLWRAPMDVDDP